MEKDNYWKTLQVLLPVASLVGGAAIFLTLLAIKFWQTRPSFKIWALTSLLIYGCLWFVMISLRRRTLALKSLPDAETKVAAPNLNGLYFLIIACLLEASFIGAFFGGLLEFDTGVYSIFANSLLGASALVFVVSLAILRIPAKWPLLIATALVLAGGAAYYFYLVVPELSGV